MKYRINDYTEMARKINDYKEMARKMKTTKSNVIFSLNFVLTIPESKTHPFSLNCDTTRFD